MKKPILFFMLYFLVFSVIAQERISVTGNITDHTGLGLPGVSIVEKGTLNGTVSDVDGNFMLSVSPRSTLVFSFIGFITQEIPLSGQTTVNIQMQEDVVGLEEVVVVGYGKILPGPPLRMPCRLFRAK